MGRYAQGTNVSVDSSRAEIEKLLHRYGADQFALGWEPGRAMIMFSMRARSIRFVLPMPDKEQFRVTPARGIERHPDDIDKHWEQACRQSWRALSLVVKAKLEAVEAGITCFDDEFMANIVDPRTGKTIGELIRPQLKLAYEQRGSTPKLIEAAS